MLEKSSILMLNCIGSYFYSIVKHLSQNGTGDSVLYYLDSGNLTYHNLSAESVQMKYNSNPWGYQPVDILNAHGQPLEINESFFDYLSESHNIKVRNHDMNKEDLISCLRESNNQEIFSICNVDEYYMPQSEFYQKLHNKHFVFVKEILYEKYSVEIIDSEKNHTYQMTFQELEEAVYKSIYKGKIFYQVDGCYYENKLDVQKLRHNLLKVDNAYLQELMNDVENKLIHMSNKPEYYFKGYYYTIISKIIPYYQMLARLREDNSGKNQQLYEELVLEWRNIAKYMRLKMYRRENNYSKFLQKLNNIYCKENAIDWIN